MSQGSNSSGGGGGGNYVATSAQSWQGETIDFTNTPLVYSLPPKELGENVLANIQSFYDRHKNRKSEYGMSMNADGIILSELRGKIGQVTIPRPYGTETTVHTHSRGGNQEDYSVGGPFSQEIDNKGDIYAFNVSRENNMVAVGAEGYYWMIKGPNYDGNGLLAYAKNSHRVHGNIFRQKSNDLQKAVNNKTIGFEDAVKANQQNFNEYMVAVHNDYLAGQKTYGYRYGLTELGGNK